MGILSFFIEGTTTSNIRYKTLYFWIADVVFLNSLHVGYTVVNVFKLDSFKKISEYYGLNHFKHVIIFTSIFIFFTALLFFMSKLQTDSLIHLAVFSLILAITKWHTIKQTYGLSLQLNQGLNMEICRTLRTLETVAITFLIISRLAQLLYFIYPKKFIIVFGGITLSIFIITFFIIIIKLRNQRNIQIEKSKFIARYANLYIESFSVGAGVAAAFTHGFEYYNVNKKIAFDKNGTAPKNYFRILFVLFLLLTILVTVKYIPADDYRTNIWYQLPIALLLAFSFYHYLIDSLFFKFRHPIIKKELGYSFNKIY